MCSIAGPGYLVCFHGVPEETPERSHSLASRPAMHVNILELTGSPPRARGCEFAKVLRPIRPACLTDLLKETPEFIDGILPQSRRSMTYLNRWVRARPQLAASEATKARNAFGPVAGAVDRGVLYLSGFDIASRPAARLRYTRRGARIAAAITEYRPPRKGILGDDAAMGWLFLLAQIDPVLRGFRPLDDVDVSRFPRAINHDSVADWLRTLIAPMIAAEIAQLLRVVRDIRLPGPILANPVFGGVGPISGSDGDWIADDTLVEMKCTTREVQRTYVAQLLCYYALDQLRRGTRRHYGFGRLALCLPRQRCVISGRAEEWLAAFGAPKAARFVEGVGGWLALD